MSATPTDQTLLTGLVHSAVQLADRAVVCDVETEGQRDWLHPTDCQARPVYDISSMFNDNEHTPQFIDMASQGIAYGIARGLLELLPDPPIRVRVLRMPT